MWPVLIQSEYFILPTYLLISSLIFSGAVIWIFYRAPRFQVDQNLVLDAMFFGMIGVFLGARSFHVFFEAYDFYRNNPVAFLKFWYGGFVFYGGLMGGLFTLLIFSYIRKTSFRNLLDLGAPVLALGQGVGRLACLAAGCCYGRPTALPWGIVFPEGADAPPNIPLHPTQLYGTLAGLIEFLLVIQIENRGLLRVSGQRFGLWLMLHGISRGIIEQFRDDFRGPQVSNLSVSTWISLAVFLIGAYLVFWKQGEHKSAPGLT